MSFNNAKKVARVLTTVSLFSVLIGSSGCTNGLYVGNPREISDDQYLKVVTICERRTDSTNRDEILPCVNEEIDAIIKARVLQIARGERIAQTVAGGVIKLSGIGLQVAFSRTPSAGIFYPEQFETVDVSSFASEESPSTDFPGAPDN